MMLLHAREFGPIGPMRGLTDSLAQLSVLHLIAISPPVIFDFIARDGGTIPILLTCIGVCLAWDLVFSVWSDHELAFHGITTALIVSIFVPVEIPLWHVGISLTIGVMLGEKIFGGRGFSFLSAATVSLALLIFAFPQSQLQSMSPGMALATLPGFVMLLVLGRLSWRSNFGLIAILAVSLTVSESVQLVPVLIAVSFGATFLLGDPFSTSTTPLGRWLYGGVSGFLIALFSNFSSAEISSVALVFSALLASLSAPLFDHLAILINAAGRRSRHGQ